MPGSSSGTAALTPFESGDCVCVCLPSTTSVPGSTPTWFVPSSLLGREYNGVRRRVDLAGQTEDTSQYVIQLRLIPPFSTHF